MLDVDSTEHETMQSAVKSALLPTMHLPPNDRPLVVIVALENELALLEMDTELDDP